MEKNNRITSGISASGQTPTSRLQDQYEDFMSSVRSRFDAISRGENIFRTDAEGLFETFLNGLPDDGRQHYNCNECRRFVDRFGGMVTIDSKGKTVSALWSTEHTPEFFVHAVAEVVRKVARANVVKPLVSDQANLGTPMTGPWSHMSVTLPPAKVYKGRIKQAHEVAAEKIEDFKMLQRAIAKYQTSTVDTALGILLSDALYRSEKVLGVGKWFKEVKDTMDKMPKTGSRRANMIWRFVADAPAGFTHVSSSMIGTLLDDIQDGLDYSSVSQRFKKKMDPTVYQRPQVDPAAGNVKRGEEIILKLNLETALERRYLRLDEVKAFWKPKADKAETGSREGVFSHLKTKESKPEKSKIEIPARRITWRNFKETVLSSATKVEYLARQRADSYVGMLTAVHEDAEPLIKWDYPENRNPVSWYLYAKGSIPQTWDLNTGYVEVKAICDKPSLWNGPVHGESEGVILVLDGAKDSGWRNVGLGLFPEILRSELREIRSTMEGFSASGTIQGHEEASANGIMINDGSGGEYTVRVTTELSTAVYVIDRWS